MPGVSAAARRFHGMRNRFGGSFDQECTIVTPGPQISNGAGGWMDGAAVVQANVPCEVRFPTVNPKALANQVTDTTLARVEIRVPVGTSVSVDSTITVGPSSFEVRGHDTGRSFASEIICDCVRVADGGPPAAPPLPPPPQPPQSTEGSLFGGTFSPTF